MIHPFTTDANAGAGSVYRALDTTKSNVFEHFECQPCKPATLKFGAASVVPECQPCIPVQGRLRELFDVPECQQCQSPPSRFGQLFDVPECQACKPLPSRFGQLLNVPECQPCTGIPSRFGQLFNVPECPPCKPVQSKLSEIRYVPELGPSILSNAEQVEEPEQVKELEQFKEREQVEEPEKVEDFQGLVAPVSGISFKASPFSIKMSWKQPDLIVYGDTMYQVHYFNEAIDIRQETTDTSITVTGLTPETVVNFEIRAVIYGQPGPLSRAHYSTGKMTFMHENV